MQNFIRGDFIQKLWWSLYLMEEKLSYKVLQLNWELATEQVPIVKWKQINFSFLVKTEEYFYIVVFKNQMSVNCVINIRNDPIHFAARELWFKG